MLNAKRCRCRASNVIWIVRAFMVPIWPSPVMFYKMFNASWVISLLHRVDCFNSFLYCLLFFPRVNANLHAKWNVAIAGKPIIGNIPVYKKITVIQRIIIICKQNNTGKTPSKWRCNGFYFKFLFAVQIVRCKRICCVWAIEHSRNDCAAIGLKAINGQRHCLSASRWAVSVLTG